MDASKPVILSSRPEAAQLCAEWHARALKIGFTSGTFDLLHAGHVSYLECARAQCDRLIVAINSDNSVRSYKGSGRPFVAAEERARIVAALACVDAVFIFDETNNNENIKILRPDVYFKAGDYEKSELSSGPIVESYGGKVQIVPFVQGKSSSNLIERIAASESARLACAIELPKGERRPAAFIDRDGTLIEHIEYLHEPERVRFLPGAMEGLKALRAAGYYIIIVTNQPGIGLGYFTKDDFFLVMREMMHQISRAGVFVDKIYFCPHSASVGCQCRKPGIALLERAFQDLSIDKSKSGFFGDMTTDIQCGKNAGIRSVLVGTGRGGKDNLIQVEPDVRAHDFKEGVEAFLR